ncbi:MAG TPA: hypothetical protein VGL22_17615 [Terracidiphilus sp.]|jgi:hypothetical protein
MAQSATAGGQSTGLPVRKVLAGGVSGAITTIVVFVLNNYVLEPHGAKLITGDIGAAITTVLSFVVSYFIPPGPNESVIP